MTRAPVAWFVAAGYPSTALVKGHSPGPCPWSSGTWPRTGAGSGPPSSPQCVDLLDEVRLLPGTDMDSYARFACLMVGYPCVGGSRSASWLGWADGSVLSGVDRCVRHGTRAT